MEVSIAFGDGIPEEPIMAEGRDNYEEYDIKNFENDIMFEEVDYDSVIEAQEEMRRKNEAAITTVEAEPEPEKEEEEEAVAAVAADEASAEPEVTKKTTARSSTTSQVTTPSTTSVTTSGMTPLVVEDPVDKEATTIYRDLLIKLKDSLSTRWVLAKRRRK